MKAKLIYPWLVLCLICTLALSAQQIEEAEYFFDADPGVGNADILGPFTASDNVTFNAQIPTGLLLPGFHKLVVRCKNELGQWSTVVANTFYLTPSLPFGPIDVAAAEYFIDADPGAGNGEGISIESGQLVAQAISIPIDTLELGFHKLAIRTRDASGRWSTQITTTFYVTPALVQDSGNLAAAEYFIDNDPGAGNGTTISTAGGQLISEAIAIPIDTLELGFHKLAIRTRDASGRWSTHIATTFYVTPALVQDSGNLLAAEYFIDNDPGAGNGTGISTAGGQLISEAIAIPIDTLELGFHKLAIRTQDASGRWSTQIATTFFVTPALSQGAENIVAAEYFVDAEPGIGQGTPLAIASGLLVNESFVIDLSALQLEDATHTLSIRVRNEAGRWSLHSVRPFTICDALSNPAFTAQAACAGLPSLFTNTSTAVPLGSTLEWDFNGDNITDATGAGPHNFIYAVAGTYQARLRIIEPSCSESFILPVVVPGAVVPTITAAAGATTVCGSATLQLTSSAAASFLWSNGATGQSVQVLAGSFSVITTTPQGCTASSAAFVVSALPQDDCGECYALGESDPEWNTTCVDCAGVLAGGAEIDLCGICSGGGTGLIPNASCSDCAGVANGTANIDACGVCAGGNTGIVPNSTCSDCAGVIGGTASIDACGVCAGGNTGVVPNASCTDCSGVLNGTASVDACGVCAGGTTGLVPNASCSDCAGIPNGAASVDACGLCSGGNTGLVPNASCADCAGVPNGGALPGTPCIFNGVPGIFQTNCTCLIPLPDLLVQNITSDQTNYSPSGLAQVSWEVSNAGLAAATTAWTEKIYVESSTGLNRILLKQSAFNTGASLLAGQSLSRTDQVTLPALLTVGDLGRFVVEILPVPATVELAGGLVNNISVQAAPWTVNKVLNIIFSTASINEGASASGNITRSGSLTGTLVVNLAITNPDRFSLPATVTFQAGQSSRPFTVAVVENALVQGAAISSLSASAAGFQGDTQSITALDNDNASLSFVNLPATASEGEIVNFQVSTNVAPAQNLTVFLSSSSARFPLPATVVIAAGSLSANVTSVIPSNSLPELDIEAVINAGAAGSNSTVAALMVLDDDIPGLQLIIETDTISEAAGFFATTGTLIRTEGSNPVAFTANLSASIPSTLILPTGISLAANQNQVTFNIGVIDNAVVEGFRTVVVNATLFLPSCGCGAPPTTAGFVNSNLVVVDNDGPSLTLSATPLTLAEGVGNAGTLRISRNTPTNVAITASLSSSNTGEVILPATATIPIGAGFVDVPISTVNDNIPDGNQQVYLQANSEGFSPGVVYVIVTDQNKPDLQIASASVSGSAFASEAFMTYTVNVLNSGFATAPAGINLDGFLSEDLVLDASDILLAQSALPGNLPAGETVSITGQAILPSLPGTWNVIFKVNPNATLSELLFINNTSTPIPISIEPDYTATASVQNEFYFQGGPVAITGVATRTNGNPAAGEEVEIYILTSQGLRREVLANTDANGNYSAQFVPLANEAGSYTVGASYPGLNASVVQDVFDILGVRVNNGVTAQIFVTLGSILEGSLEVQNLSGTDLLDFTLAPLALPNGASITFETLPIFAGNSTVNLPFTASATEAVPGSNFVVAQFQALAAQGVLQTVNTFYYAQAPAGFITASISNINTTASVSTGFTLVSFEVTNNGAGFTSPIQLSLPQVNWLTAITPLSMPPLGPGETTTVVLKFWALAEVPFNVPLAGSLSLLTTNGNNIGIPFTFQKVSEADGGLQVLVTNEFSYFGDEQPLVEGAFVRISNYFTNELYAEGFTGPDGSITFPDVPEGSHRIRVEKEQHQPFDNTVLINPGVLNIREVFISYQAVTFTWSVVPVGIEDNYEVTLTTVFETNVPIPVVTIDMPEVLPALQGDELFAFNVTLTNHGLITARDVDWTLPNNDPEYEFVFNYTLQDMPALSAIQIPVLMKVRTTPLLAEQSNGASINGLAQTIGSLAMLSNNTPPPGAFCQDASTAVYWYTCGPNGQWKAAGTLYKFEGRICIGNIPGGAGVDPNPGEYTPPPGCAFCPSFPVSNNPPTYVQEQKQDCKECIKDLFKVADECLGDGENGDNIDDIADLLGGSSSGGGGSSGGATSGSIPINFGAFIPDEVAEAIEAAECLTEALGGVSANALEAAVEGALCIPGVDVPYLDCIAQINGTLGSCLGSNFGPGGGSGGGGGGGGGGGPLPQLNALSEALPQLADGNPGLPAVFEQIFYDLEAVIAAYTARGDWAEEYFGALAFEPAFRQLKPLIGVNVDGQLPFELAQQIDIAEEVLPFGIQADLLNEFFTRWNTSMEAWNEGVFSPNEEFPNIIDKVLVDEYIFSIDTLLEYTNDRGFGSIPGLMVSALNDLQEQVSATSNSVCASVSIEISQQVTMTREAFEGTLGIVNGHPTDPIDSLTVNISITDPNGVPSNGLFQIEVIQLNNISDVDGGGTLAAQGEATVKFLFIPTIAAAPEVSIPYGFGGSISYLDPFSGQMTTLELTPVQLLVNPSPDLYLHYFLERNILSDDALTPDVVEPTIPAELAVMIENSGNGPAVNLTISSAQPEIVANETGLAIDFNLIGSNLQGQPTNFGLTNINFGTIPPVSTRIGQWLFTSSLLGKFVNYDAEVVHSNSFGNPELSLIEGVTLHELTHSIKVYGAAEDGINDFLVNDIFDIQDVPDVIYISQGFQTFPVFKAESGSFDQPVQAPSFTNTLTIEATEAGWNFIKLNDPGNGLFDIESITRSDGQEIPLDNGWLTFVTLPAAQAPIYENKFHFVDDVSAVGSETYTIVWSPKDFDVPEVVSISGADQPISAVQVETLTVSFSKPIDPDSFTFQDLGLVLQGSPIVLSSEAVITQIEPALFEVDLSSFTLGNGFYIFTVQAAGIDDIFGISGNAGEQYTWAQFADVPAVQSFESLPANNLAPSFDRVDVRFNLPVEPSTVTPQTFTVLLDGVPQPGALTIDSVSTDQRVYYLSGLGDILTQDGTFELSVDVTSVETPEGIPGEQDQSIFLTRDSQGPEVVTLVAANEGGLDLAHLNFANIQFNEDVFGFTISDVELRRNGNILFLNIAQLQNISQDFWKGGNFQLLTYPEGDYSFKVLLSGITDALGNAGAGIAEVNWTVDRTVTIEVTNLGITPDLGISDTDGITSTLAFDVEFELNEAAAQVSISQLSFSQEIVLSTLFNLPAGAHSIPVLFPSGGNTGVKVSAQGLNGGTAFAERDLFLDESPLNATWQFVNDQDLTAQVGAIPIQFSTALLSNIPLPGALELRRNGLLVAGALGFSQSSDTDYLIEGVSALATESGEYELRIQLAELNKASSGRAGASTPVAAWSVSLPNQLPEALDDSYTIGTGETLLVSAPGVLGNDFDQDGELLQVVAVNPSGLEGQLILLPDGSFTFIPDAGAGPLQSFGYTISDGEDEASATVSISIAQGLGPIASDFTFDESFGFTENIVANQLFGLGSFTFDPNNDVASWEILETIGVEVLGFDPLSGLGVFSTNQEDFNGEATISWSVTDSTGLSDSATITIIIAPANQAPVAIDDAYTVNLGETLTVVAPGVLANDFDPDGDAISALQFFEAGNGTVSLVADGAFTYTPNPGFTGADSFIYLITDGTATDQATVSITILSDSLDCAGVPNGTSVDLGCGCGLPGPNPCCGADVPDCLGVCGGSAVVDCLGVCGGSAVDLGCGCGAGPPNAFGCCGSDVPDCLGVCGGSAVDLGCGCGAGPPNVFGCCGNLVPDCLGVCGGSAVVDCLGVCGGSAVDLGCGCGAGPPNVFGCCGNFVPDCSGVCGGSAVVDCLGVCGGSAVDLGCGCGVPLNVFGCCGNNVPDCSGTCGGSAVVDCSGVCGGSAVDLGCGCGAGPPNLFGCCGSDVPDCLGVCGGLAATDLCGVCRLPGDPETNSTCLDCAGVPNGSALQGSPCFVDGLEGTYDANCTCVANPVQEPCRYFLSNYNSLGGSDIYEFALDETNKKANLNLIHSSPHKVSLALNTLDGRLMLIRESGNAFQRINVVSDPPTVGPETTRPNSIGLVTGAAFSDQGLLYVATQTPQAIWQVSFGPVNVGIFSPAKVNGGDLAFNLSGELNLLSRIPQKVYIVTEGSSPNITLGPAPALVTGVARKGGDAYLVSVQGSDELILGDSNALDLEVRYQLLLDGLPFVTSDGDMASGCLAFDPDAMVDDESENFLPSENLSNLYSLPNPTEGISTVVYQPATSGTALLEVYDIRGVRLATIFNLHVEAGQVYSSQFDGSALPNGVYLYRLTTDSEVKVEKFMIAR